MNQQVLPELLARCITALQASRRTLFEGVALLYQIKQTEAFKEGGFDNFSDFVEQACQISRGHASKLLSVYEHFVIQGGVLHAKLAEIDSDKLYMALRLPGTVEEQVAKASTLSRSELKLEQNDETPHDHTPISICSTCHIRL